MFRKSLCIAAGALALVITSFAAPAYAGYAAIAASSSGSSYVEGYRSMEAARSAAVDACRRRWGGSCAKNTAESDSHYFAAGDCDGEVYTAASIESWDAAAWLVRDKARRDGYGSCRIFARN